MVVRQCRCLPLIASFGLAMALAGSARGQAWPAIPTPHSVFQAVKSDGSAAYAGGFPLVMRGVLLNDPASLLDATPNYLPYSPANAWNLGGQWQIYFQSVAPGDFGGTAAWMGQNYGNLGFIADSSGSYTNTVWTSEIDRLGHDPATGRAFRAGDLIEVRARTGLSYNGEFNINEAHDIAGANDFEVILLQSDYGLPVPADLSLANVKDATNRDIFDPTRASGGERYQGTLVRIGNVHLASASGWAPLGEVTLTDGDGRTLPMLLGSNPEFGVMQPPAGEFSVIGIFDQDGADGQSGYRLWLADPAGISVPEPSSLMVMALALPALLVRRRGVLGFGGGES